MLSTKQPKIKINIRNKIKIKIKKILAKLNDHFKKLSTIFTRFYSKHLMIQPDHRI